MVDRLVKIDTGLNRVLETRDDQGSGGKGYAQPEDEKDKKKKDKFDKGKPFWKRLIPENQGRPSQSVRARLASGDKLTPLQLRQEALLEGLERKTEEEVTNSEEMSVTLSRRILVLWGVVDIDGHLRIPVIITYAVVAAVMAVSTFLILGILFRGT